MTVSEIAQPRTIAERIASEGIPIADALRYAMLLAEALRGIMTPAACTEHCARHRSR